MRQIAQSQSDADWLLAVQEIAGVGIWDWQLDSAQATCTESNTILYGLPPATVMPPLEVWRQLIHPDDRSRVLHDLESAASASGSYDTEFRVIWSDGTVHWLAGRCRTVFDSNQKPVRLIGVNYDISRLKEAEQISRDAAKERTYQAHHDLLTGLPNRRFLDERLEQAVVESIARGERLALLFIDLDGFKIINDSLGHAIGDELLGAVARRLRAYLPESSMLARTGGDEFTMILTSISGREAAVTAADAVLTALREPFYIDRQILYVTASVGISICPDDGDKAGILKQNADIAMYRTKRCTKNGFQFFASGMIEPMRRRLALETQLRQAIERDELKINYQPVFAIGEGDVGGTPLGFEALLRWTHPMFGDVPPSTFIPIAEETGMIISIGAWVLQRVCRQIRVWRDAGFPHLRIDVNVSSLQFALPNFLDIIAEALGSNGVPGDCLGIEITESVLMGDLDACSRKICDLQKLGVSISIDDFGTGYSSLSYLQQLPIKALKIDGSFIREIGLKPTATALIEGIVLLAHRLDMRVIAECVETEEQLEAVLKAGCDGAQGYLLGLPAPTPAKSVAASNVVRAKRMAIHHHD